jgi:hypothetical protein
MYFFTDILGDRSNIAIKTTKTKWYLFIWDDILLNDIMTRIIKH